MCFLAATVVLGLTAAACGSGTTKPAASSTPAPTVAASSTSTTPASPATPRKTRSRAAKAAATTTALVSTSASAVAGAARCPTRAQADAALGASYTGPISNPLPAGGVVCEYSGGGGTAAVAIYAHQSAAVFAGQVAHAPGAPAMGKLSGVGDGAYGMTAAGRSIVNAYSDESRTNVAAQAPGALGPVEALARVALADN